jgi:Fibronectin type III domain
VAAPKPKTGGKILGLDRKVAIYGGLAVAAGIAFFLWRAHKNKTAAATTPASSVTNTGTVGTACTDSNGNPGSLDANGNCLTVDQSGSIAALQTEIGGLQTSVAADPAADAAAAPPATTTTPPPPDNDHHGGGGTPPPTTTPGPAPMATGLHTTAVTSTGATANWNPIPQPGALYSVHLQQGSKFVGDYGAFRTTSYTFHGLKPKTSYTWKVAAYGNPYAPWSTETSTFTTT